MVDFSPYTLNLRNNSWGKTLRQSQTQRTSSWTRANTQFSYGRLGTALFCFPVLATCTKGINLNAWLSPCRSHTLLQLLFYSRNGGGKVTVIAMSLPQEAGPWPGKGHSLTANKVCQSRARCPSGHAGSHPSLPIITPKQMGEGAMSAAVC